MDIITLLKQYLPFLVPLFVIQLAVVIYALVDLARRKSLRGPRPLWLIGLILGAFSFPGGVIIACLYLFWGRNVEAGNDQD